LKSPELSQGAVRLARVSEVSSRVGSGVSLPDAMSTAKTVRSGVLAVVGSAWLRRKFTGLW
jgi:hypothetical protein